MAVITSEAVHPRSGAHQPKAFYLVHSNIPSQPPGRFDASSALPVALVLATIVTFAAIGGWAGIAYLLLFIALGLSGLPIGAALFGLRHAAGWIAGLAIGYAATTLAWWTAVFLGYHSTPVFVLSWAATTALAWLVARGLAAPLITLPKWNRRDTAALCLLMLMTPLVVGRPFARIGSEDSEGNRRYRAYFTADFVWHMSVASELARYEHHPVNPFLADRPLHYYWTYFRIPATVAEQTGMEVQNALKLNATATSFVFLAAIYLAAWAALPAWPYATALGVALAFLGPSAEGLAAIADLLRRGHSLAELRDLNIDAVASWAFKGVRVDNLPRAMWYNPQHSFSIALGLLAVPCALWNARGRTPSILLTGCALGASLAFNPLLGAAFCATYGITLLAETLSGRASVQDLLRHALAAVPVAVALAWCTLNEVGDGAGATLHFGFWGPARNATLLNMALQLGPIFIPLAVGLWPRGQNNWRPLWPSIAGLVLGLFLMHFAVLTVNPAWIPFRGGQILLVLAPAAVTWAIVRLWESNNRGWAIAMVAVVVVSGVPTSAIDEYNTQDVTNYGLSPGNEFHWTIPVTPDEQQAVDWIRRNTPLNAIVQADTLLRARETWTFIPSFAERRMITGLPIALLPVPEYDERNARVRTIYATEDAQAAWQEAKALGINYLYMDRIERDAHLTLAKFAANPQYFKPVFTNAEAAVYEIER